MKQCSKCHQWEALEQFSVDRKRPDGRNVYCKPCVQKYHRDHYQHHGEEVRRKHNEYRAAHRELSRAYMAKYREKNRQKILASRRKNAEHARQKTAAWFAANPERAKRSSKEWRRKNLAHIIAKNEERRAKKLRSPTNDFTKAQWEVMKEAYKHRCAYCSKKQKRLTQDHITPLFKGGSHTASNIVPACKSCNSRKGTNGPLRPVQPLLIV